MRIIFLLLAGGILTGFIFLMEHYLPELIHQLTWKINVYLLLLTLLSSRLYQKLLTKDDNIISVLAVTVFRMLFSLLFVAIMVVIGLDNKVLFGFNFFVLYLLYQSFDIYRLITNLHANLKRSGDKHEVS